MPAAAWLMNMGFAAGIAPEPHVGMFPGDTTWTKQGPGDTTWTQEGPGEVSVTQQGPGKVTFTPKTTA